MKNLIKKILREQVEDDLSLPKVEDNAIRRIKVVLDLMKPYADKWDEYLREINIQKKDPARLYEYKGILENLLKIVGGGKDIRTFNTFDRTYWFAKVFQINGGKNRNFKEGEIELIELPKYEMEAQYSEEATDYRTGWGDIVGAHDEAEAIEYFEDDIGGYIEDSESNDMDYGDIYDVEDVVVQNVAWIRFQPEWVGLK